MVPMNNLMLCCFPVRSKKSRQLVVISQRRTVTEEEKNNALKRAKKFKSKNPFAVQVMMESYVCGVFLGNVTYYPMLFHFY